VRCAPKPILANLLIIPLVVMSARSMRDIVLSALAVVAVLFPISTITARAAEISAAPPLNGVTAILIKGEIESGDAHDFVRRTDGKQRVLVVLSSPGGAIRDALTIAAQIRTKGFTTTVADQCVSACALVWLSGVRRYLNSNARVGFHAAYVMKNGVPVETGMGNAEVGAFLAHLGLSREAIQFVTAAPPEGVRWLSYDDASRLGISIAPSANVGASQAPPAYVNKPALENETRRRLVEIADLGSQLSLTLKCSEFYYVNTPYVKDLHSQLMKDGSGLGKEFVDFLNDALIQRSSEIQRDGLERFCEEQKKRFIQGGLAHIYLN
jgi:hypothetical protein